jgi:16S rRNA (guanine527-N7)-methyltransferase
MSVARWAAPDPSTIVARALDAGITLSPAAAKALALHAEAVLASNERLHLTAITEPGAFFERHLGEAFEGAALLPATIRGVLLDLGSGNGYPGIPLAIARPGLSPVLAEASSRKAAFLREALGAAGLDRGRVLEARVARAADLDELPSVAVLATRAMGGWERIVPKLASRFAAGTVVLVWAGPDGEAIMRRTSWSRLKMEKTRSLPGREHSYVYRLSVKPKT